MAFGQPGNAHKMEPNMGPALMAIINQSLQFVKQCIYTAGARPEIQALGCGRRSQTLRRTVSHTPVLTCTGSPALSRCRLPQHIYPGPLAHGGVWALRAPPHWEITRRAVPVCTNLVRSHHSSQAGPELHQHPGDSPQEHSSLCARTTARSRR